MAVTDFSEVLGKSQGREGKGEVENFGSWGYIIYLIFNGAQLQVTHNTANGHNKVYSRNLIQRATSKATMQVAC
jgi:hypothetical protein